MDLHRSMCETYKHKQQVTYFINKVISELNDRALCHDDTKLNFPEADIFAEYTYRLKTVEYGSEEYKQCLKEMKPALDNHYAFNKHHPEHFADEGIEGMSLIDLIEMMCDWYASCMRHTDGDVMKSIDINQTRFGYSDELAKIFRNTIKEINKIRG